MRTILLLLILIASKNTYSEICSTRPVIAKRPIVSGEGFVYDTLSATEYWILSQNEQAYVDIFKILKNNQNAIHKDNAIADLRMFKMRMLTIKAQPSRDEYEDNNTEFGITVDVNVTKLIKKKKVCYRCIDAVDQNGSILCSINNESGDLGEFLIGNGYAEYDRKYGTHPWLHDNYLKAEQYAKSNYAGMWAVFHETKEKALLLMKNEKNGESSPPTAEPENNIEKAQYGDNFNGMP